jgi:hypothetical protein
MLKGIKSLISYEQVAQNFSKLEISQQIPRLFFIGDH